MGRSAARARLITRVACVCVIAACGGEERPEFYSPNGHDAPSGGGRDSGPQSGGEGDAGPTTSEPANGEPDDAGEGSGGEPAAMPPMGCEDGPELHVLFIGNSHTTTNDLPAHVRELACAAGTKLTTGAITHDGWGVTEHLAEPATQTAIESAAWDYVIMQDQQQRPGFRLEDVEAEDLPAALALVKAITTHRAQTRTLFYMVWARREGDQPNCEYSQLLCTFEGMTHTLDQGYRFYAERARAQVSPVALAWAAAHADPKSPLPPNGLWIDDGSHATPAGTYLAAAVLVGTLLDVDVRPLQVTGGLDATVAELLRSKADQAVTAEREDPRVRTREGVQLACDFGGACSADADEKPVVYEISTGSCDELQAGTATVAGRIDTRASCLNGICTTVALGDWHRVPGAELADGRYQLRAYVDVNDDGELDSGDLETCLDQGFTIGGGEDAIIAELGARE